MIIFDWTETRYWGEDSALKKVFGLFGKPEKALLVEVLLTLTAIQNQENIKPTDRAKTKGFCESLLEYKTILTVQFLRIFEETSPLSKN